MKNLRQSAKLSSLISAKALQRDIESYRAKALGIKLQRSDSIEPSSSSEDILPTERQEPWLYTNERDSRIALE